MSNYDVIETFVVSSPRVMMPAEIVQMEGEVQFTRFQGLEQGAIVLPAFEKLQDCISGFDNCVGNIRRNFIRAGYLLNEIKRNGLYRFCTQKGVQGYTDFYVFCEDKLNVSRTTAKRLIAINSHFCGNGLDLPVQYSSFGASKLAIMSQFKRGLENKITPDVTVAQLNKLTKYYQAHDWKVSSVTTWKQDLNAYENEVVQNRQHKSNYLRNREFISAKDVEEQEKKPSRLISDNYKTVTRFFDQTLDSLKKLETEKNAQFQMLFDELKEVLKKSQGEVLRRQAEEMTKGL